MTYLARIADRVINRPLLIHPQKAEVIAYVLGNRIGLDVDQPTPDTNRFFGRQKRMVDANGNPGPVLYNLIDRAAVVTIEGSLVNRGGWIGADSGVTSYEGIDAQLTAAAEDSDAAGIVAVLDTPGGEATGLYGLAERIREIRTVKPVVALVNDMAASAGYGIASQADEIIVSPTSVVGSIGVVLLHADFSKALDNEGIKPTLIYAGAHKVDGNPFEPLPDAVRADLQREVETFYDTFVETVVAGRGDRIDEAAVRATEARVFIGAEAVSRHLADRTGTLADAIAAATGRSTATSPARTRASQQRRADMPNPSGTPGAENPGITREVHDAAVSAATDAGRAEGAQAERDRFSAILADESIKGRERAAMDLALKSPAMSAEDVAGFVSANLPEAKPERGFARRKAEAAQAAIEGLGIDPESRPQGGTKINTAEIYASRRAAVNS